MKDWQMMNPSEYDVLDFPMTMLAYRKFDE